MSGFEGEPLALLGVKVGTGVFLKAGVVVGSTWLATLLCRRESAAVRCAIWSSALATLIILPFLSAVMPSAEIAQVASPHGVVAEAPAAVTVIHLI